MKLFYIKRKTSKVDIYHRTTKVYKCFLWWEVKLLYCYGIRIRGWCVPGADQAVRPIGLFWKESYRVMPATTKWETDYFEKAMFTNLINQ